MIQVLTHLRACAAQVEHLPRGIGVVFGLGDGASCTSSWRRRAARAPDRGHAQRREARGSRAIGTDNHHPRGDARLSACAKGPRDRRRRGHRDAPGVLPSSGGVGGHGARRRRLRCSYHHATEGALPSYICIKELALISARVAKSEDYPASSPCRTREVRLTPLVSDVCLSSSFRRQIGHVGSAAVSG